MIKKLFVFALVLCIFQMQGFGQQTRAEIQQKQRDLQNELDDLNASLKDVRKNQKSSLRELNLITQKIKARESLIVSINNEVSDLNTQIATYNDQIEQRKKQLDTLREKYAQSLVFAYKNRSKYNYINFLFSSSSFNDAIRRVAYLKSYRQFRETQASNIKEAQAVLKDNIAKLENTKQNKGQAIVKQNQQLGGLQNDRNEKDSAVVQLKTKAGDIANEIAVNASKRRKLQQVLRAVIRREIAEAEQKERARQAALKKERDAEEQRQRILAQQKAIEDRKQEVALAAQQKAAEASTKAEDKSNSDAAVNKNPIKERPAQKTAIAKKEVLTNENKPQENPVISKPATETKADEERKGRTYNVLESSDAALTQSLDFEKNKGHLPWPINGGFISGAYGVQTIPGTNLKQENDGVEMTATGGSTTVKSVASGTVSVVISDETYSVIIRHGKYFTTYSNLGSVSVSRGESVNAGTIIGTMASGSGNANTVFFMVTDSKGNALNPMSWLKGR